MVSERQFNLTEFNNYALNDAYIRDYLKQKSTNKPIHHSNKALHSQHDNQTNQTILKAPIIPVMFFPNETDSLFWCYFIAKHGDVNFEILPSKNEVITKQIKIDCVMSLRENKHIFKAKENKFASFTDIETNLVNDPIINHATFLTLMTMDRINVVLIRKNKTYIERIFDASPSSKVFIVQERTDAKNKYKCVYGILNLNETSNDSYRENELNRIHSSMFRVDNINKPINSISFYKLSELQEIASQLKISIYKTDESGVNTGKNKLKQDLYNDIIMALT